MGSILNLFFIIYQISEELEEDLKNKWPSLIGRDEELWRHTKVLMQCPRGFSKGWHLAKWSGNKYQTLQEIKKNNNFDNTELICDKKKKKQR